MNRDKLDDNEPQSFLLIRITENNQPVQLDGFLSDIYAELGFSQPPKTHWYRRIFAVLDEIWREESWISVYSESNDGRQEFYRELVDPPSGLLLETTPKGQARYERLPRNSSRKKKLKIRTNAASKASKSIREQVEAKRKRIRDASSEEKAIEKIVNTIAFRQGQQKFRKDLFDVYGKRCLVTGCDAEEAIEAAHIRPYAEGGSFELANGLLLRADIHTLFDLGLIAVDSKTLKVILAAALKKTEYGQFNGKQLQFPKACKIRPDKKALQEQRTAAGL